MSNKRNTKSKKLSDNKKDNPHAKRLKLIKKQQDQLKKQKEEKERLRLEEEEKERIYQEKLKIEEDNRQEKLLDRQKQRELNKNKYKKDEESRLKQREQAYAKYGINVNVIQKKKEKKGKKRFAKNIIEKEEDRVEVIENSIKKVTNSSSSSSLGNWDDDTESKSINNNKKVSEMRDNSSCDEEIDIDNDINYRSPVCCVLGHVNAGKTSLLDKIRSSTIQGKEIGGISQQIGGTMITKGLIEGIIKKELSLNISGLLIIDTPGHKTFSNLRKNGVQICDFAILVVDMFKGIEDQTIESIKILQENNIPYIIILNKMDMISEWVSCSTPTYSLKKLLTNQNDRTLALYNDYIKQCIYNFAEYEINAIPYYNNKNVKEFVSIVPVSSLTGEGLSDMFLVMLQTMKYKILNELSLTNNFNCKVLEINKIIGYGLTPTVILIEGTISLRDILYFVNKNNELVACKVKSILLFEYNKEVREEKKFTTVNTIVGTCCCKIICTEVEQLLVGIPLYDNKNNVVYSNNVIDRKFDDIGVLVHASTLGALESFVTFLNESNIPIAYKKIGEVTKKDVIRAQGMITKGHAEYATILCFDIEISHNIINYAFGKNVSIFKSNIIYELEQLFTNFFENKKLEILKSVSNQIIYPCTLKILPEYIIHDHNPIILGVFVQDGTLKNNTPICTIKNDMIMEIGTIVSIELNNKRIDKADVDMEIAISIKSKDNLTFGRQFNANDILYSHITRHSLDILKEYDQDFCKDNLALLYDLKGILFIN